VYRSDPGLNWSLLKAWRRSPLHGHHAETTAETESSDALDFGRAFHCATLEPDLFAARYVVWNGGRRAGRNWEDFALSATAQGQEILTTADYDAVRAMADAVRNHPACRNYFDHAIEVEAVRRWTDNGTGTNCKARLDAVPFDAVVLDLKSARDYDPRRFTAKAWDLGYQHQMAWYRRGQAAKVGRSPAFVQMVLIAVEKVRPYDVCVMPVRTDTLDDCDAEIDELLALRQRCRESGNYPGAYPQPVEIGAPAWAYPDESMELMETDNG
jgi:exodeoxyribonuclease VIII